MESDRVETDGAAPGDGPASLRQLEFLVRSLGEELAGFRRRAHAAEARVKVLESAAAAGGDLASIERVQALEAENAELRKLLGYATQRTRQLAARVKFVRQQAGRPVGGGAS